MSILTIYLTGYILAFIIYIYTVIKDFNEITVLELIIISTISLCSWIALIFLFIAILDNSKILNKVIYKKNK